MKDIITKLCMTFYLIKIHESFVHKMAANIFQWAQHSNIPTRLYVMALDSTLFLLSLMLSLIFIL
jgi:hypothetical protein